MTGLLSELLVMEEQVWEALEQGNADADRRLLSPDFLGVYPSGFAGRDCHVGQLGSGPSILTHRISEARAIALSDDIALLSYRADVHRAPDGPCENMYIGSIWRRTADGWINIYSQDTISE